MGRRRDHRQGTVILAYTRCTFGFKMCQYFTRRTDQVPFHDLLRSMSSREDRSLVYMICMTCISYCWMGAVLSARSSASFLS